MLKTSTASATSRLESARRRRRPRRQVPWLTRILVYGALCAICVPTVLPFIWLLRSSVMDGSQMFVFPPQWIPDPFRWSNYGDALTAEPFGRFFLNTMVIELLVVTGTVISCSMAAFSFSRLRWRGRDLVFGALMVTLMLPYAATLIPTFLMWDAVGAYGTILPLTLPAWFGGVGTAGVTGGAFYIFLFRQFFMTIPYELDEAAYSDGATPWKVYWRIIMPLSRPVITIVVLFSFVATWSDFLGPLIYLQDESQYTVSLGLATFQGLYNSQWGYLMAASATVMLPIILLFLVAQRYFLEGVAFTGLKN